jgi:hypothetical protein
MRVGQSLDLALVPGFGGHGTTTSDDSVLRLIGGPQADATVAYSAVATGEALLTTTGAFCVNLTTYEQSSGVCPLLAVSVVE